MHYLSRISVLTVLAICASTAPLAYAADEETAGDARTACLESLNIPADLMDTGTYAVRLNNCVRQRLNAHLSLNRKTRLHTRTLRVQERTNRRNTRLRTKTVQTPEGPANKPPEAEPRNRMPVIYRPQDVYEKLLRGDRPTKRWILGGPTAEQQSATRLSREHLQEAMDQCRGIGNRNLRSACVLKKRRQLELHK